MRYVVRLLSSLLLSAVFPTCLVAGEAPEKLSYQLSGRMLLDGGVYLKNKNSFKNGTEFSDLRLGAKATYADWTLKIELGYAGNKVSMKDVFLRYTYKRHSFQVGYFYEPFTMDMLCSTFDMRFHQSAGAVLALANSRRIGLAYTFQNSRYNLTTALFDHAADFRLVYYPVNENHKLVHIGSSVGVQTPEDGLEKSFIFKSPGVSSIDQRNLLCATVPDAKKRIKMGLELVGQCRKFLFQGEYLCTRVERLGKNNYLAQGGYGQISYLLIGDSYAYDAASACPARPEGKALEICARFNQISLNHSRSGIQGGSMQNLSLGLNFYINKHVGIKANYNLVMQGSYIHEIVNCNFSVLQLRLQFIL